MKLVKPAMEILRSMIFLSLFDRPSPRHISYFASSVRRKRRRTVCALACPLSSHQDNATTAHALCTKQSCRCFCPDHASVRAPLEPCFIWTVFGAGPFQHHSSKTRSCRDAFGRFNHLTPGRTPNFAPVMRRAAACATAVAFEQLAPSTKGRISSSSRGVMMDVDWFISICPSPHHETKADPCSSCLARDASDQPVCSKSIRYHFEDPACLACPRQGR